MGEASEGHSRRAPHGVFLLEDDARIRDRFRRLLEAADGFTVAGTAGSLADASKHRDQARSAHILLVDLRLPDGMGTQFIAEAAGWSPRPCIAVISALGDERNVISAIEAGADGYLLKDLRQSEFIPMLESLLRGEAPISPAIARYLLKRFRPGGQDPQESDVSLSARETEVLTLIAKGYAHGEIAQLLKVAESTVVTHVKHIYDKLDVHSRGQAVFEAAQRGLIKVGR